MVSPASTLELAPAVRAFDAVAERFDARFGAWESVSAQRRAVRAALVEAFPNGSRLLELGGGTGEDAAWLAERGRTVFLTDPSPSMVRIAAEKVRPYGLETPVVASAEDLSPVCVDGAQRFDGAFSNFAALNCTTQLTSVARGLAIALRPGARVLLVVFGICSPGEFVVQMIRGDPKAAVRRLATGDVHARLGGQEFTVRYHRAADFRRAFQPWFHYIGRRGIGVFVPPSAAEPWISRHPRALGVLEALDRVVSKPLAVFGDHVLLEFERTEMAAPDSIR
ncbi:MAG: class I SAM-dependent methyltransferase [Gemmatimonadota bacterium]